MNKIIVIKWINNSQHPMTNIGIVKYIHSSCKIFTYNFRSPEDVKKLINNSFLTDINSEVSLF